ncbi:RNA-binding protein [Aerococcaceae bacterium DSM 111020]|nr:RNA-binding protein [Aerococcaceae bacterium DSM 111020]
MSVENIYQHYRVEEQPFIDEVFGWLQQAENTYAPYLSNFLTPREAMIVKQLVGNNDELRVLLFGGYEGAERQRAFIYFSYYEPQQSDFEVAAFNINYPTKFGELTHGRILGTLMSTGVDRNRVGDIISDGERWHIIVDEKMQDYFQQQITKIANVGVKLEPIDYEQLLESNEQWSSETVIAASLRLDTLLSNVYNFSRQRAKNAIQSGLVKVNFVEMERPDVIVGVNDIVSLRKFGRFWIDSVDGTTKKDNYRLTVNILEH